MIDGGILAGYLAAAPAVAGRRVVGRAADLLFEKLRAAASATAGPAIAAQVEENPTDGAAQARVGRALEDAARQNPLVARELEALLADLDREVGRSVIVNEVFARTDAQAFGRGHAALGDYQHIDGVGTSDFARTPSWVRLALVVGPLLALVGIAIGVAGFARELGRGAFAAPPALGVALFFLGFVLTLVASLGKTTMRPRSR